MDLEEKLLLASVTLPTSLSRPKLRTQNVHSSMFCLFFKIIKIIGAIFFNNRATYIDGKPQEKPKPCAANQGTKILVEDLFYNVKTRRDALKASEEFSRICDLVGKYSIHNCQTAFSLKKQGEGGSEINTPAKSSAKSNIQLLYGSEIFKELFDLDLEDKDLKLRLTGQATTGR